MYAMPIELDRNCWDWYLILSRYNNNIMPYQQYRQLRRHLQSPRRLIVDPFQRECNPPEDPNWPAPTASKEIFELMQRLPHLAQVVCALTAAEMVLPIWGEHMLSSQSRIPIIETLLMLLMLLLGLATWNSIVNGGIFAVVD